MPRDQCQIQIQMIMQTFSNNNRDTYGSTFSACDKNCDVTADLLGSRDGIQCKRVKCLIVVFGQDQCALATMQLLDSVKKNDIEEKHFR